QNPLDLQLELSAVQVPEAFTEALKIATLDLRQPALDRPDIVAVVEIELKQCEDQRDCSAEQEDAGEEARTDPAAHAIDGAPCRPDLREHQQSSLGLAVILAGGRPVLLRHAHSAQRAARC